MAPLDFHCIYIEINHYSFENSEPENITLEIPSPTTPTTPVTPQPEDVSGFGIATPSPSPSPPQLPLANSTPLNHFPNPAEDSPPPVVRIVARRLNFSEVRLYSATILNIDPIFIFIIFNYLC